MDQSEAVSSLPPDLQQEYSSLLAQTRSEINAAEGTDTVHSMILERYVLVYCMLKDMERNYTRLDMQRYNQLFGVWISIGAKLLEKLKELYDAGAVNDIIISKVMTIVSEEVGDTETLARIRARIAVAQREEQDVSSKR